ncbi:MAG: GNAT family N-acetyltransferase [Gammaproteobacteria bacterium]|nr:GNAT family N-acetyltransferase [Gammaproteobacteria bacterium]
MYKITTPVSVSDFESYYQLRWELLRKPWNQISGSEKDDLEEKSFHRMAVSNDTVIAIGRLHFLDIDTAQIRYMAVEEAFKKQGIGKAIYFSLEKEAYQNGIKLITLNAREKAVGFYEKLGFTLIKKTHLLFNEIQHYEMHKHL